MSHKPVLLKEAVDFLEVVPGGVYLDATVGEGGHSEEILKRGGSVLGIDLDPESLEVARIKLGRFAKSKDVWFKLINGNFANIDKLTAQTQVGKFDGSIFDLGLTTSQLKSTKRGFSFSGDGPLDARLSPKLQSVKAADLLNILSKKQLHQLFSKVLDIRFSRALSESIVGARRLEKIERTNQFANLARGVASKFEKRRKIDPATTAFLALRIAVNSELENLKTALGSVGSILKNKARLVVVSFHSGEDRIVKRFLRDNREFMEVAGPIYPGKEEILGNPSASSAIMRVAEKI